jgi:hypothetical protein
MFQTTNQNKYDNQQKSSMDWSKGRLPQLKTVLRETLAENMIILPGNIGASYKLSHHAGGALGKPILLYEQ